MKIGIITLHRVLNYGSALQAYALQKYIQEELKEDVEIIDYIYPNKDHKEKKSIYKAVKDYIRVEIRDRMLYHRSRKKKLFLKFYDQELKLSESDYDCYEKIKQSPPIYDLYMTGSDQVWNYKTLKNDPAMYCVFAPSSARRIAFGASFSLGELPCQYHDSVRDRLTKYSHIGVRDKSGLKILEDLDLPHSIQSSNTCDPTLLLSNDYYDKLAEKSNIRIDGDYILEYQLNYSFSAEPTMSYLIRESRRHQPMKLVTLNIKRKCSEEDVLISGIGPNEFIWLIKHAQLVLTSSFHGTMFSIIYKRPFFCVIPPDSHPDKRIPDILDVLSLRDRCICNGEKSILCNPFDSPYTDEVNGKITDYINKSKKFLRESIYNEAK